MAAREELDKGLMEIGPLVDAPELEPDSRRPDWPRHGQLVASLRARVDNEVLRLVDAALLETADVAEKKQLGQEVADLLAEVAAVLYASGDVATGGQLLSRARDLAGDDSQRAYLAASARDPSVFVLFAWARWLQRHGNARSAQKLLKQIKSTARDPALKDAARALLSQPKPIQHPPFLGTLNSIGVTLYGARDARSDGSYVATKFFVLLFLPLLPLSSYRVVRQADGWIFLGREPLGPIARIWQRLVLAGAALGVIYVGISSYLGSDGRQVKLALERASALEKSGQAEEALRKYDDLIHTFRGRVRWEPLRAATDAIVRLSLAGISSPMDLAQVDRVSSAVLRIERLPKPARTGAPTSALVARVVAYAAELGDATTENAEASLRLLDSALRIAESGTDAIVMRKANIRVGLAQRVAATYPLWALEQYGEATKDPRAVVGARAVLKDLSGNPSLLVEGQPTVEAWLAALASVPEDQELVTQVRASLARGLALGSDPGRAKALEERDMSFLQRALARHPDDQEVAVGLASILRDAGNVAGARARISSLGPEGRLIGAAQQLLGGIYLDDGKVDDAERILGAYVAMRLSPYQVAVERFTGAANALHERLVKRADTGQIPSDVANKLNNAPESEHGAIFQAWAAEEFEKDASLASLRQAMARHAAVVPAVLSLGRVKLQRASLASGDAKKKLLEEAEETFRSIQHTAEGQPEYHMGLGQVYYRLGRTDEGERELGGLVAQKDPQLTLAVARVYRELGLLGRAKELAEQIHRGSDRAASHQAAMLRYLLATSMEEQEEWLKQADPTNPFVQTALLEVQGDRLFREGKLQEADGVYARVADAHRRDGARDSSGWNNAALALQNRFLCTGDWAHLSQASKLLESAFREGNSALVAGNLADMYQFQAMLRVLDKFLDTRRLLLTSSQAEELLELLLEGTERKRVVEALRQVPEFRRSLEMYRQQEMLGPQWVFPYRSQLTLEEWIEDTQALEQLLARVSTLPSLDTSSDEERYGEWVDGSRDSAIRIQLDSAIARLDGQAKSLLKDGSSPAVQGAAWYLLGAALERRAAMYGDAADVEAAVAAYRQAEGLWKWGGISAPLGWSLVELAVLKARVTSPRLAALWKTEHRKKSVPAILYSLLDSGDARALLDDIRRLPEWHEGVALIRTSVKDRPKISDWILARVAEDAELEKMAAATYRRPVVILNTRIAAKISAWSPWAKKALELLEKNGS